MAQLMNCRRCGVLFKRTLRDVCEKCLIVEKNNIEMIERFVRTSQKSYVSMTLISEHTEIPLKEIEELYTKGCFTAIANRITTNCKSCGCEIKDKEKKAFFCEKCAEDAGLSIQRTPAMNEQVEIKVDLRNFQKDVMHSNKAVSDSERLKYGFKKNFD